MSESSSESSGPIITRRALLTGAVIGAGSIVLDGLPLASAQTVAPTPAPPTTPVVPADPTAAPGGPTTAVSVRSPFETPARTPLGVITGASFSPIHQMTGRSRRLISCSSDIMPAWR